MLNIINNLRPFIEDCYRRISVREYSRLLKVSPPTASKILFDFNKEGLLSMEKDRNYLFYYASTNNRMFIDLSRIYWRLKLDKLIDFLIKNLTNPTIILFGSLSKAETKNDSDIDLCIIGHKKELNIKIFESQLKRNIQLFFFGSIQDIKNKELANNIVNGYVMEGRVKL
ncbi:MAG TPA: nucleotidyltransferase domain-containing protein [Candidatus Nanoarchaeia archaeon]|nr:nucleotidyltransferase domain-containing protein [Candidatus Nanoarchaeia archaeon]